MFCYMYLYLVYINAFRPPTDSRSAVLAYDSSSSGSNTANLDSITVFWSIQRLPIIIGGNVTLFCNTTRIQETKVTWMKNSDVIVHHGLVFYPSKYTAFSLIDGSSVPIIDAGAEDFNVSYTCISDVFSYEAVLKLNETNYIVLPDEKSTAITCTWYFREKTGVNISWQRIYPIPKCELLHNKNLLSTTYSSDSQKIEIFYSANLSFVSNSKVCEGNLELRCTLITEGLAVGSKYLLPSCKDKHLEVQTSINILIPFCITVSVILGIGETGCLIYGIRKSLRYRDHEGNYQMEVQKLCLGK